MNLPGTLLLTIVSLLERLSYYGAGAILVLFAMDESGLNLDRITAFEWYGLLSVLLIVLPIPFGLITDKLIGQTRSIYVGGFLCLLGYLLLVVQNSVTFYIAIVLLAIGISLVKPSTTILIGRQFIKGDRTRTLAYVIFFFGVNLGAFVGIMLIGHAGELHGWHIGFLIAAIITFLYLLIFRVFNSTVVQRETNQLVDLSVKVTYRNTFPILAISILVYLVFMNCSQTLATSYLLEIISRGDKTLLGFDLHDSTIDTLSSLWVLPATIAVFMYWKLKGIGKVFNIVGWSFLILLISSAASKLSTSVTQEYVLDYAMIPFGLFAITDTIVTALISSYVTRLTDTRYSNTTYALFILSTHLLGTGILYLIVNDYQNTIITILILVTITLLVTFRNQIRKLTFGIE